MEQIDILCLKLSFVLVNKITAFHCNETKLLQLPPITIFDTCSFVT